MSTEVTATVRSVARNTGALFVAEALSRGMGLVYFAILARYIQSAGLGKLSTAQALITMLIILVSYGFDQLLIRDVATDRSRLGTYVANVALLRVFLSLFFVLVLFVAVQLLGYERDLALIIYVYGANALLQVFVDIVLCAFQAFERMEYNLVMRVCRDVINVGLSLLAIFLHYSLLVIVGVSAIATLVELVLGIYLLRKRLPAIHPSISFATSRRLLIGAAPFALVLVYPLARSQLNTLVLAQYRPMEDVGWFGAANGLVLVLMIVPALFMRALFPVFSRLSTVNRSILQAAYQKAFTYLLLLGLAISAGIFLTAEPVIWLILGPGFAQSVPILRILAWLPLVSFVGYCNGNTLCAIGKERVFTLIEGCFTVTYVLLAFALTSRLGYVGASIAMLAPTVVGFGVYSVYCHRLLGIRLPWQTALRGLLATLAMAAAVFYALRYGVNLFVVALVIGPVIFAAALFLLGEITRDDVTLFRRALRHA